MKRTIAKSEWLRSLACPSMGWFGLRTAAVEPGEADRFLMEQGQEIGRLAHALFPGGELIGRKGRKSVFRLTAERVANPGTQVLFEAAFTTDRMVAKADIISREGGAWHVLEVKSSFAGKDKPELVDDLAYTVMVATGAGLGVAKASLVLLSRGYRLGDDPESLFEVVDKTAEVEERVAEFQAAAGAVTKQLVGRRRPEASLVEACRGCEFFESDCLGRGVGHSVLELPRVRLDKMEGGPVDLADLPDDFKLTATQERVRRSALGNKQVVGKGLAGALAKIEWPCHYLDFETVTTAPPLYKGRASHEQILTQFSLHHRDSLGGDLRHDEYLADPEKDCELELAKRLIRHLGEKGSIIVYASFEKTRINALAKRFPELQEPLAALVDRLVDLRKIIENHFYHPEFRGSFSIKRVLPVLVPGLTYKELDVQDGATAVARFARMARGEITGRKAQAVRRQLLAYCERDTLAMVRLHEELARTAGAGPAKVRAAGG